jgi:two-component system cell cycle response regulator
MPTPIIEKIKTADNLPSLPTVAIQVLQMTQADDVSLADIARVIQQDPALTVKVLKVVNSSLFGMSRRISSVQQAMVVLGLRTVKVMVLSFSLVDTLKDRRNSTFDYTGYWRRSLTTAVAAKSLAERVRPEYAEEAFVCGLLCDIGTLAAYHCARDMYLPVLQRYEAEHQPLQNIERIMLGVTHEAVSMELLDYWGLPESLCLPVSSHHAPISEALPQDEPVADLCRILRAAAMVADLFCTDTQARHLETCKTRIRDDLPIQEPLLNKALEDLDNHVKETASLFSLAIGPTRSYEEIQAEAVVQLARLSMAAELERAQIAQREQAARQKVEQLNSRNRELAERVVTDSLTKVGNRAAFEERLAEDCRAARMAGTSLGLILLDLDRFKRLNDTFGHQVGDEALRQVGNCLNRLASPTRFPARYGGEEFALIVSDCAPATFRNLAEDLRLSVQALSIPFGLKRISITISIGAVLLEPDDPNLNPKAIIKRADECLYEAKHTGRNRVVFSSTRQAASPRQRAAY